MCVPTDLGAHADHVYRVAGKSRSTRGWREQKHTRAPNRGRCRSARGRQMREEQKHTRVPGEEGQKHTRVPNRFVVREPGGGLQRDFLL